MLDYVELHCHTYYSPLDGLSSPEEFCTRAKELGINSLAITDHGTLAGTRHFQQATLAAGIKPIIGVEAYISQTDRFDRRDRAKRQDGTEVYNHIILLAKNQQGVIDLNRLSEIGWTEGFYKKPRIDFEVLDQYGDNIIVLSGCMSGLISKAILNNQMDDALMWTRKMHDRFADDFYIEIQSHNPPHLNYELLQISDRFGIKPVITGDCHYADPVDKALEEAFLILGTGPKMIENPDMSRASKMDLIERFNYLYPNRRMTFEKIDVFLESAALRHEKMKNNIIVPFSSDFSRIGRVDIFENTIEISNKVEDYLYRENEYTLPRLEGEDINKKFVDICERGLKARGLANNQEYRDRLDEETRVILEKDLASYFVILWDALTFCRKNGILYGFGRGSAAGSLVCYLMELTEVDPIEYNLLFWRFLDPERADMPDIDTDIQDSRRIEVKSYLIQKYGEDRVAGVTTYGTYRGKSAIAAACKVLGLSYKIGQSINKKLPDFPTTDKYATTKTLDVYERHPDLVEFRKENPEVLLIARKIADRICQYSMHPSGIIITDQPLNTYTALEARDPSGSKIRQKVTALDGDDAAELGLVKYDLLGLITLSIVADALKFIRQNHGKIINFKGLKEDDPNVFRMISEGHTVGIFQSDGQASVPIIKKMGIDNFNDLVVSNALVRPGAWKAFGEDYLQRKKGLKKTTYPTDASQKYLDDTFGFALYQEQSMLVCTDIGKMSKGDANKVRKLTAKKKNAEELKPFKDKFMNGARQQVSDQMAEKLWQGIEITAEYSFNKCLAEDTRIKVRRENRMHPVVECEIVELTVQQLFYQLQMVGSKCDFFVEGPEFVRGEKIGKTVWHKVKAAYDNGVQNIYRIWIDDKTYIDATATHKHRLAKNWKEAYRIHQNDVIWTDQGKRKVWKRSYEGSVQTYDVELYDEPHAFYANGFLTHNSHTIAYSKLSYVTAWLKYYYPAEFMTALLTNVHEPGKYPQYLAEAKRLGLRVHTPDINHSDLSYTCKGRDIYMGLANIKGIGEAKAEHIIANRPYASYAELVEKVSTKGNGLDKTILKNLDAIGAIRFADHEVDEDAVVANYYEYLGIPMFDDGMLTEEMQGKILPLDQFDGDSVAVVSGIVQEIISKNGWTKINIIDSTGAAAFFVTKDHGLIKGNRYLMVLDKNSLVMHMDMSQFDNEHPIVRHLRRSELEPGTFAVAAKQRETKTGKKMATLVYSRNGDLKSCAVFESHLLMAKQEFKLGERVRIAIKTGKMGDILEAVQLYR